MSVSLLGWLVACLLSRLVLSGHEVLYKTVLQADDVKPEELAVIQFDSRLPLRSYWNASAHWNAAYCSKWGHQFLFLSMKGDCSHGKLSLAPAWCKVKAMIEANAMLPRARAFLYMDSDAFITVNYSMTDVLAYIRKDLKWNTTAKPLALNQDGPGWACKNAMKLGYHYCLNSGTLLWLKSKASLMALKTWWDLAAEPYDRGRFTSKWRQAWPWEQAQLYKVHDAFEDKIMRLSFPDKPFLPWTSKKNPKSQYPTDYVEPWCFSHWPGANCFITHGAASQNQKLKLMSTYALDASSSLVTVKYISRCRTRTGNS